MLYRDYPALHDASTSSSASFCAIGGDEGLNKQPPAYSYTDEPTLTSSADSVPAHSTLGVWCRPPPDIPFSSHDLDCSEFLARFPNSSTNATTLYDMIREQAKNSPGYYVNMTGWHNEPKLQGNKETESKITEFLIQIKITHLLARGIGLNGEIEYLPNNIRCYRGRRQSQTGELKA
ncbi:hypothetical protein BHYA_0338g00010 [Botrytis hyacinthi]|uniref:Uncharacterized protein n=1 Tax=Botrytis hyacinthi TaxID=278943 RepID=A0A4Z1GAX0_9HELO|nr:hypothetical protein BHYA_0338g00010 [Botrytis hyacinthi]